MIELRISFFLSKNIQIYWQHLVWKFYQHILSKMPTNSKKSPPHPLCGTPLHWLYFAQCLTSFFSVDHLPCIYAWFLILFHLTQVRFSQSTHLLICCCFFNWDSLHARLKSHYEAWSYKKRGTKKDYRIHFGICFERTYS